MTKELIVSANVHEKKVAIIEDGVVTEFYVERRDENQGVVGNLYKGRVMKVLPGMQSAFVDIGLERDAFLYVSDFTEFMEEEEEIDFKETPETSRAAQAPQRATERSRRHERPQPEAASVQPLSESYKDGEAGERPVPFEDVVEQLAEIADESLIPPPPSEEELDEETEAAVEAEVQQAEIWTAERVLDEPMEADTAAAVEEESAEEVSAGPSPAGVKVSTATEGKAKRGRSRKKAEAAETTKTGRGEKKKTRAEAAETGKRKTSRTTSRRGARKQATEAESEAESATVEEAVGPSLERITDEDVAQDAGELLKDAIVQEKIIEQVHNAEYRTGFVRAEPEPEWRVGSFRSRFGEGTGFQRVVDEGGDTTAKSFEQDNMAGQMSDTAESVIPSEAGEIEPFEHVSELFPENAFDQARQGSTDETKFNTDSPPEFSEEMSAASEGSQEASTGYEAGAPESDANPGEGEELEASVRDRGSRAEFAQRRGGRGRRRSPRREQHEPKTQAAEEDKSAASVATAEAETKGAEEVAKTSGTRSQEGRQERRGDGYRRPESAQGRRPERGGPPTISELLHEGQEILVQIAKEPIAKKGARITSHMALPGRYLVYMPTVNHVGVSRKIPNEGERIRLKRLVAMLREREGAAGGFIARTACAGHTEQELQDDMRYLIRTWADIRKKADRSKSPSLVHRDLDLVQRILRDQLSEEFSAIRVDNEVEYARIVEFVNRVQPKLVKRVKLYTGDQPILEKYAVQPEIDKAVRPRVWLKSGGYIVINQTEALVAIDVNTGKFVGKSDKLEDTITRTNLEAAKEIVRQVRLRDLGGIIVIDFIDMEERKNRQRVMATLQQELTNDRAPSKILSINDFGLVAITRKRVKQSLERTLCTPCPYCQGAGMVKSAQTVCFEVLEQAKAISKQIMGSSDVMLRVSPGVAEAFRTTEGEVLEEIEAYFGTPVTIEADPNLHQEQYDFAIL
jgi:ribonuclease G